MANLRETRRHIRSVAKIAQVTRAMQMVSASKMKRAQEQLLAYRPYVERAQRLLTHLAIEEGARLGADVHPLLASRPVKRTELLLVTGSRGFCGALNHSVIQAAARFILEQSVPVRLVTVGSKGRDWMLHHGQRIVAEFADVGDEHDFLELRQPIAEVLLDDFERGLVDEVHMAYPQFVNTLTQKPAVQQLLPIRRALGSAKLLRRTYLFEPDREALLADLLPRLVAFQVFLVLREAIASEHSARMVAMREATDNAEEMLDYLNGVANRARQKGITQEAIEVSEGAQLISTSP